MLAKVIAYAPTRAGAARRLASALAGARVHGPVTNRDQLVNTLRHEAFLGGATDTGFLDRHDTTARLAGDGRRTPVRAGRRARPGRRQPRVRDACSRGLPSGWRNVPSQPQRAAFEEARGRLPPHPRRPGAEATRASSLVEASPDEVVLDPGGVRLRFAVAPARRARPRRLRRSAR